MSKTDATTESEESEVEVSTGEEDESSEESLVEDYIDSVITEVKAYTTSSDIFESDIESTEELISTDSEVDGVSDEESVETETDQSDAETNGKDEVIADIISLIRESF